MTALRYRVVDVFAIRPYTGNPLAVVLGADGLSAAARAAIARELNLSETAFLVTPADPGAQLALRIHSPDAELPFAGHPVVGATWVAAAERLVPDGTVTVECVAGVLTTRVSAGDRVEVDCPPPSAGPPLDPAPFLVAAGLDPAEAVDAARVCSAGLPHVVLPVRPATLARAVADPGRVAALTRPLGADCLVLVDWSAGDHRARIRALDPSPAIVEDTATGSAAAALGAWLAVGGLSDGEHRYLVEQGHDLGRPAAMHCRVTVEAGAARLCRIAGQVVPVASGEIEAPGPTQGGADL